MKNVPQFNVEKNRVGPGALKDFIVLFELTYDTSDPSNPVVVRFAQYNVPVQFEGVIWNPFPIAGIEITQATTGEIPAFDIAISNAGRLMIAIFEQFEIENKLGRLVWVHPDASGGAIVGNTLVLTDATAKIEEPFTVMSARATEFSAVLTVAPVNFDPLVVQLPAKLVTVNEFPGVMGNRGPFLLP